MRILVIEDEVFTRELAGMCMEDWGHAVLFAGSVAEATRARVLAENPDLTMTALYNAMARAAETRPLETSERDRHDRGRIGILGVRGAWG